MTIQLQQAMQVEPVTLEGEFVRLEPLAMKHAQDFALVSGEPEIWRYMSDELLTLEQIQHWIEATLQLQASGAILPFATVDKATNRAIGSTRYLTIIPKDRGLEIGWTWLGKAYWRTAINTECKYLLFLHAFEDLNCIRVQLKADYRNQRSRNAIERIGAKFEGILRQHVIMRDGYYRDSAYYSVLDKEWPEVKARLEAKLHPHANS